MVVRGSAWDAASCTSRSGTPALSGRYERVPKRMRSCFLGDPGAAGNPADDPCRAVPVQAPAVRPHEHRPLAALADSQVDRPGGPGGERDGDDLAALAGDDQRPVPPLQAQLLDVRAGGLGDPQPVQGQEGDQRMLSGRPQPGRDQERAELVAVQRDRV
jgi:hypothetical protein